MITKLVTFKIVTDYHLQIVLRALGIENVREHRVRMASVLLLFNPRLLLPRKQGNGQGIHQKIRENHH